MTEPPAALGRRVAQELIAVGRAACPEPVEGFPRPSPLVRALAEQLGVQVLTLDSPPPAQPGLRSEYQASPPRIILYRTAISVGRARLRPPVAPRQIEDLHIAHELFHHLQAVRRFARLSLAEEEEAAQAFAREMLGVSFDTRAAPDAQPNA